VLLTTYPLLVLLGKCQYVPLHRLDSIYCVLRK